MKSFTVSPKASVYVYDDVVHMGASFTRLSELVRKTKQEVLNGDLFLFCNKKMDYIKVLWFAKGGYCIFAKNLPVGRFQIPSEKHIPLSTLIQLVDFIVVNNKRRQVLKRAA